MPLGLDDELAPIGGRSSERLNMTYVDEVILKEHPTLCRVSQSMLVTDEATG
jgi:hypothetical protein